MEQPTFSTALTLPIALLILLASFLAIAAWLDIRHRRLPNWLSATTAVAGLGSTLLIGGIGALGSHALHLAVALALGMFLFRMGVFGAGDAKFYAACAAWLPISAFFQLLVWISLAGFALLCVWFGYRRLAGFPIRVKSATVYDGLPYGIAIGGGALLAMTL